MNINLFLDAHALPRIGCTLYEVGYYDETRGKHLIMRTLEEAQANTAYEACLTFAKAIGGRELL